MTWTPAIGWFADRDDSAEYADNWQPCLQMDGVLSSMEIWFATKQECEDFIRQSIIPAAGRMYD